MNSCFLNTTLNAIIPAPLVITQKGRTNKSSVDKQKSYLGILALIGTGLLPPSAYVRLFLPGPAALHNFVHFGVPLALLVQVLHSPHKTQIMLGALHPTENTDV